METLCLCLCLCSLMANDWWIHVPTLHPKVAFPQMMGLVCTCWVHLTWYGIGCPSRENTFFDKKIFKNCIMRSEELQCSKTNNNWQTCTLAMGTGGACRFCIGWQGAAGLSRLLPILLVWRFVEALFRPVSFILIERSNDERRCSFEKGIPGNCCCNKFYIQYTFTSNHSNSSS